MADGALWIPLALALIVAPSFSTRSDADADGVAITVHPSTLASTVSELAGHTVRVPGARVVGVFEPRVLVIDTAVPFTALRGSRDRIVVLIHPGALRVSPEMIVGSTVTIFGVARTLLGVQVTAEVAWPSALDRKLVDRLEIRAALLATSVQTADGVELTDQAPPSRRGASR
jgi:hypothetical protein